MKKLSIFTFLIALTSSLFSQQQETSLGIVRGVITDKNGAPLLGTDILLDDKMIAVSELEGKYSIEVSPGEHQLTFQALGFDEIVEQVNVVAKDTITLNIVFGEDQNLMDEVVVSAGKYEQKLSDITVSMAVLKPSLIENRSTTTCEEIIEQVPGVNMQENQVSIRGGSGFSYGAGSRVMLMVDDMPMLAGDANDVKWSSLPIENVEQIEVIKGASSVLFGSSALNGVIHLRTGFPINEPKTNIRVFSGTYDSPFANYNGATLKGDADSTQNRKSQKWWTSPRFYHGVNFFHSRKVKEHLDITLGGAGFHDETYRQGEFETRARLNMNLRYRPKKWDGLTIGLNTNSQGAKGALFFLWQNADSTLIPQGGIDSATTTLSNYTTWRTNIDPYVTYYSKKGDRHSLKTRWYNTTNINNTQQGSKANTLFGEYQFQKKLSDKGFAITAGLMGMYTTVVSDLYGDHNSNNLAAYSQFDKKFFDKLLISIGIRAEYFRIDTAKSTSRFTIGSSQLPIQPVIRFGATYEAGKATFLRASYGQGYRFPTIAEKYVSTSVSVLKIFPNPSVQPETGWSAELGIKQGFQIKKFQGYFDVAGFINQYDNMMEFAFGVYNSDGTPWDYGTQGIPSLSNFGAQSQNVQSARITGIDFQVVGTGNISENVGFQIFAGYTYMNPISLNSDSTYLATFSDTASGLLKYRFRHLVKIDVQADYKKWALGLSTRHNSFTPNIDRVFEENLVGNIGILPGLKNYRKTHNRGDWIFDSRLSYQTTKWLKTAFVVKNLLNREYMSRPGDVQPPRTFVLQATLHF